MKHKTLKDAVIAWDMARKRPAPTGAQIARLGEIIGYHSEQEEPL